ncbi:MAG: choice-of-anchor E domain-containing protein, partial [Oricola sp.]|nr:choice-of-anchor E domain-containing protein [Oricola sp.]
MFKGLKIALAAAGCAFAATGANAATVTYTDLVALSDVEIGGTLSVPQFNAALGTLTGVTWTITGTIATILGVENDS